MSLEFIEIGYGEALQFDVPQGIYYRVQQQAVIESLRQQLVSCQMQLADTEALEVGTGERLAVTGDESPLYTADQLAEAYEAGKRAGIPEGWVVVPKEPTKEMLQAGFDVQGSHLYGLTYSAMLAAAPKGEV